MWTIIFSTTSETTVTLLTTGFLMRLFTIITVLIVPATAELSSTFRAFIGAKYGKQVLEQVNRADLGKCGSFGGGEHNANLTTRNQPVIIVHGVLTTACTFGKVVEYLFNKGYADYEVYATTWGNGFDDEITTVTLNCSYVRQIRNFIRAVSAYTRSKVDILAYSMGSPLSRKAILGGKCVENNRYLGKPLTKYVDAFVSVAGANYGSFLCEVMEDRGICNRINGLNCNSSFLIDINCSKLRHYEGAHTFAIYSDDDDMVGGIACGHNMSSIRYADGTFIFKELNHVDTILKTVPLQYSLAARHGYENNS